MVTLLLTLILLVLAFKFFPDITIWVVVIGGGLYIGWYALLALIVLWPYIWPIALFLFVAYILGKLFLVPKR